MDRSKISTGSVAPRRGRTFAARALAALLCALPMAVAWALPAQIPLLSRTENPAKPNIVFTFDDSGSMSWRFMPDSVGANIVGADTDRYYMTFHHKDDSTFGNASGDVVRLIPTRPSLRSSTGAACTTDTQFSDCRAADLISARARSAAFNSVYYNPEIQYVPWSTSVNGTLFPASSAAAAWLDPMDRTAAKSVNLVGTTNVPYGTILCRSATTTAPNVTTSADRNRSSPTCAALPGFTHTNGTCTVAGGTWSSPECRFTSAQGATSLAICTGTFGGSSYASNICRVTTMNQTYCQNKVGGVWANSACEQAAEVLTPATYYQYLGGDMAVSTNYQRIRIMDYSTFTRGDKRGDCTISNSVATCTQAQEYQNFANWFTYYRTRNYLSIAASSLAFADQPVGQFRLGWGRINKAASDIDGVSSAAIVSGVRPYVFSALPAQNFREQFFTWLYSVPAAGNTPLRRAMDDVGKYYQRTDNRSPWVDDPSADPAPASPQRLECRKSYHILMTDGFWNGTEASTTVKSTNWDNTTGPVISGPSGQSFKYVKARPYQDASDSTLSTLADVAMYYWNRDLQPGIENRVKPDAKNPAFWQSMVNFTVGLGVGGTLNYPSDLAALQSGAKNWPAPAADSASAVDDLWHAAVNSRGEYLSAKDPDEFSKSLSSILNEITIRNASEGGVAATAATLQAGNRKYVPEYKTAVWTGNVTAYELDQFGQQLSPVWNAESALPTHDLRTIFVGTRNGNPKAEVFKTTLSATLKAEITGVSDNLINYLRGANNTGEGGVYRTRPARLGDFVNSQPVFIKSLVDMQYNDLPAGTSGKANYKAFLATKAARPGVLVIGGNDGMLHGFRDSDGAETFGFIPRILLPSLSALASPSYEHRFYVDGQITESDAYFGGGWKNVVVASTGAGARAVFALNSANLTAFAANTVLWELDSTTQPELGYVMASAEVGLLPNGQWAAVFGNGPDSASGTARLFIVNIETGAVIKTIQASSVTGNGLGGVRLIRDANRVVQGAYAGDLKGNVWKFDLTGTNTSNWNVSFSGTPLYTSNTGANQPIVAAPQYVIHPQGGYMVLVGTGKLYEEGDQTLAALQALYGLWDKQQLAINTSTGAVEWTPITPTDAKVQESQLVSHSFGAGTIGNSEGATFYTLSTSPLNWQIHRGWKLPLTLVTGHRNLLSPTLVFGYALFETMSPTVAGVANACEGAGSGGSYNLLVNPVDGSASKVPLFDTNADGYINSIDSLVVGYKGVYDGRDVVLTQKPCLELSDCPPDPEDRCQLGTKLVSVQSALGGNNNFCINLPAPERWWWRQIQQVPQ